MRGVIRGRGMRSFIPARRTAQPSSANCNTPETVTPQASEWPTVGT